MDVGSITLGSVQTAAKHVHTTKSGVEYIHAYGRSQKMFKDRIGTITPDELISEQAKTIKDQQELIATLRKMLDFNSKQQKELEYIASYYKVSHQVGKTIEECAELIKALAESEADSIVEEMADVENMIAQLKFLFGVDTARIRNQKIERQLERIMEEKKKLYINEGIKKTIAK